MIFRNTYLRHRKTEAGYRFGSQLVSQLLYFMEKPIFKTAEIIPNIGFRGEWIAKDLFPNGYKVHSTGGAGAFISGGVNLKNNDWLFGASVIQPLAFEYADGEVNARTRLELQVSFLFN